MTGNDGPELSKSEEGYIETIHALIREHGFARVADIAKTLDIKPPSVTNMLKRLDKITHSCKYGLHILIFWKKRHQKTKAVPEKQNIEITQRVGHS